MNFGSAGSPDSTPVHNIKMSYISQKQHGRYHDVFDRSEKYILFLQATGRLQYLVNKCEIHDNRKRYIDILFSTLSHGQICFICMYAYLQITGIMLS